MEYFTEDDVVFTYTRKQAIADGVQVNLSERFPSDCRVYKYPVFCTQRVWQLIESAVENPDAFNDFSGVIKDICMMSVRDPGRKEILGGTGTEFTVIITGASIEPDLIECDQPMYRLQAVCGPMDFEDPSPAITIMFPGED